MSPTDVFRSFPKVDVDDELILREFSYDDQKDYFEYMNNEDVIKYVPKECIPDTMERAKEEIEYNFDLYKYKRSLYWAIAQKKDNKIIGSCGFNYWNRDHARAELSYDLGKKYWGKGIMTRAVRAMLGFGFTRMELHRIEATVTPTNIASLKVLRKLGFKKEGTLREQKLLHGKFYDATILSLISKEYLGF